MKKNGVLNNGKKIIITYSFFSSTFPDPDLYTHLLISSNTTFFLRYYKNDEIPHIHIHTHDVYAP